MVDHEKHKKGYDQNNKCSRPGQPNNCITVITQIDYINLLILQVYCVKPLTPGIYKKG